MDLTRPEPVFAVQCYNDREIKRNGTREKKEEEEEEGRKKKRNKRRMERKVEAGLDFRLTLGGGEGAIKIGEEEGKGIRNKEKEKEEEKPEADRNVECKSVDCSLSFQNLQWLLLFPSPVFYSTFPISGLALLSYNFPFIVPLLFHSTLSLSLFFFICTATAFRDGGEPSLSRQIS